MRERQYAAYVDVAAGERLALSQFPPLPVFCLTASQSNNLPRLPPAPNFTTFPGLLRGDGVALSPDQEDYGLYHHERRTLNFQRSTLNSQAQYLER